MINQWDEEVQSNIELLYGLSDNERRMIARESINLVPDSYDAQESLI